MLLPLALIVLMAWSVFWIDPALLPTQIGVSTASVFSLIAFRFGTRDLLPPVHYMTRGDFFEECGESRLVAFSCYLETDTMKSSASQACQSRALAKDGLLISSCPKARR